MTGARRLDFSLWEKKYGRKLTEEEKLEIEINLRDLLKTVGEIVEAKPDYFKGFLNGIQRAGGRETKRRSRKRKT